MIDEVYKPFIDFTNERGADPEEMEKMEFVMDSVRHRNNAPYAGQGTGAVREVILYPRENAAQNYTQAYKIQEGKFSHVVVRRGNTFKAGLVFNHGGLPAIGDLMVVMSLGDAASPEDGTLVQLNVPESGASLGWSLSVRFQQLGMIVVDIGIPPTAHVGRWEMSVVIGGQLAYRVHKHIYVIFNPWNPEDTVYMEDDVERNFYTMNDRGVIFHGTFQSVGKRRWFFGQFEKVTLPAIEFLIRAIGMPPSQRNDPVQVTRALASAVNANDNNGVVMGRWVPPYSDGIHPFAWSSSAVILNSYMEEGGNCVKYGQCFVFGTVLCTMLRALGIPCRVITNLPSAHVGDGDTTVDLLFDAAGRLVNSADSIWNYHIWCECWMQRPELPPGYGGWQVIDGTPQAPSDQSGKFEVGPFPVRALLEDRVDIPYDGRYAWSAVKADCRYLTQDATQPKGWRVAAHYRNIFGVLMVTESINDPQQAENITGNYKQVVRQPRRVTDEPLELKLDHKKTLTVGEALDVTCVVSNRDVDARLVNVTLRVVSATYDNGNFATLGTKSTTMEVLPGSHGSFSIKIRPKDYIGKLHGHGMIVLEAAGTYDNELIATRDVLVIDMPKLVVDAQNTGGSTGEVRYKLFMKNPFNVPLTHCEAIMELPATTYILKKVSVRDVPPGGAFEKQGIVFITSPDTQVMAVSFMSRELPLVQGFADL